MIQRFERFSFNIFEISHCWHKLAAEEMEKHGLRGPHAIYLLAILRSSKGLTAAELCEMCRRDKADVSRAVRLMEQKGFIARQGGQYRAVLTLTAEGRRAAEQICERAAMAVEVTGTGFSEAERETFYKVLDTITCNMKQLTKDGIPHT